MTPAPRLQPAASRWPRFRNVEAAKLLEHQMYFWGKDVLHPAGNLLVAFISCATTKPGPTNACQTTPRRRLA
jgi:hypothetical protein